MYISKNCYLCLESFVELHIYSQLISWVFKLTGTWGALGVLGLGLKVIPMIIWVPSILLTASREFAVMLPDQFIPTYWHFIMFKRKKKTPCWIYEVVAISFQGILNV